jgi:hypothetical protein
MGTKVKNNSRKGGAGVPSGRYPKERALLVRFAFAETWPQKAGYLKFYMLSTELSGI